MIVGFLFLASEVAGGARSGSKLGVEKGAARRVVPPCRFALRTHRLRPNTD